MKLLNSLSRLKKKAKHRLIGRKRKPNELGADVSGERVESTGSRPASEPHVIAGGSNDQGGKEYNADQERRGADVDVEEVEQTRSHSHSDVEVVDGSGLAGGKDIDAEKVERVYRSPSTTSIPHDGKYDSKQTRLLSVTFSGHSTVDAGTSAVPEYVPETRHLDKSSGPSAAADETKSNWKSTASATAKLLLRGVRDSADAFGPLKSVAGGLCFILENREVLSPLARAVRRLQVPQRTKANTRVIESLAPRVKMLAESLFAPVSEDDIKEGSRKKVLEQ